MRFGPSWNWWMPVSKARMDAGEKMTALTMAEKGSSSADIARLLGRNETTICRYLASMIDTSDLAKKTIKAGASRLAERIIRKADVKESIELLSRPGIDVIAPAVKGAATGGGFGIRVSVGVGSCGTVVQVEGGSSNASNRIEETGEGVIQGVVEGVPVQQNQG